MYISYNWLRELTGTMSTPSQLRERLTMVGLAIDVVGELPDDSILDVEVPSNRPDCLSHIGIAREVSVIESGNVSFPPANPSKVEGRADQRIVVRRARSGETITTLDGVERELTTDMLMIADAERPVAIAGIMGGADSEISDATVDVLVESAYFDPDSVRRTARALGMD